MSERIVLKILEGRLLKNHVLELVGGGPILQKREVIFWVDKTKRVTTGSLKKNSKIDKRKKITQSSYAALAIIHGSWESGLQIEPLPGHMIGPGRDTWPRSGQSESSPRARRKGPLSSDCKAVHLEEPETMGPALREHLAWPKKVLGIEMCYFWEEEEITAQCSLQHVPTKSMPERLGKDCLQQTRRSVWGRGVETGTDHMLK